MSVGDERGHVIRDAMDNRVKPDVANINAEKGDSGLSSLASRVFRLPLYTSICLELRSPQDGTNMGNHDDTGVKTTNSPYLQISISGKPFSIELLFSHFLYQLQHHLVDLPICDNRIPA